MAVRWLTRATWAYLVVAAAAALALWTVGDRWWPATVLLFGPRWIVLLPLALLLPLAIVLRRMLLLPLAAAAAVALIPVMGLRLGWRSWLAKDDGASTLRVVTLNTGAWEGLALELPFQVRDWRADIVALQECGDAIADAVRAMPGWHHHVAGPLCLLSRHRIREVRTTDWGDLAPVRQTGLGGTSQAVEYIIEAPPRTLRFVNVHLETPRKGLEGVFELDFGRITANTTLRAAESRRARQWLGPATGSVVIVGDFNMPVESAIYRADWSEFRNAFSEAGSGFGTTRDHGWIQVRIDHVLTGPAWKPVHVAVGPVTGLDHRPVITDLVIHPSSHPSRVEEPAPPTDTGHDT